MAAPTTQRPVPEGPGPADPRFWHLPPRQRDAAFARLRALDRPVYFRQGRQGFHALVRHADVVAASRAPGAFGSEPGVTTPPPARWVRTLFGDSMVNLDGTGHTGLRRIVSRAFTPRLLARVEDDIRGTAARVVSEAAACGADDFVASVAARLPYEVICTMMGIPGPQRRRILDLVDRVSATAGVHRSWTRRLLCPGPGLRAMASMQHIVAGIGRQRRRHPADDLITALVTTDADGQHLNGRQLGSFFSLLLVAGVETTRNALAHGLHLLSTHPQQRSLLLSDLDGRLGTAVEEVVRHCSPIIQFRRTVRRPYDLRGHRLSAGDTVVLFYSSANRDERIFDRPDDFDVTRSPNPHVGFGGGGPHHCLGAHLARQEMRALFHELFTRYPRARSLAAPRLAPSSFDHRVMSLPFTLTP